MPFQIVWFFFGSVNFGGRLSYEKKWPFVPSQGLDQAPSSGAIPNFNYNPGDQSQITWNAYNQLISEQHPKLIYRPSSSKKRNQKQKYTFCVFCKTNGEDNNYYMSHTLKVTFCHKISGSSNKAN